MVQTTQDIILGWLEKIDGKVSDISHRLTVIESKNYATVGDLTKHSLECRDQTSQQRPSMLPSTPVKRFDGKIRIDIVQVVKIIGLLVSMFAAAAGYDIAFN